MIRFKMAFWRHLGGLGSHLGAQNMGRRIPSCEQRAEKTPKTSENGPKMGSKLGLKPVQNGIIFGVPKNVDSWSIFEQISIKKSNRIYSNSGKNSCLDWRSQKNATFTKQCKNQCEINFLRFQHYSTFELLIRKTC